MNNPLDLVVSILVSITGFLAITVLDGVERKVKAAIQSRIGPPITQTLYDLLKLFTKETKPIHSIDYLALYYVSFTITSMTSIFSMSLYIITGEWYTIALSLALFSISLTALTIIPLMIPNPFSYIGGMREVILSLVNESVFIVSTVTYLSLRPVVVARDGFQLISIGIYITLLILIFLSGYALTGRPPFDIAEAEPELASGILIELSGPLLAIYISFLLLKRFIVKFIIAALITVWFLGNGVVSVFISLVFTSILWVSFATMGAVMGRSRVDVAPLSMAKIYISLFSLLITELLVVLIA